MTNRIETIPIDTIEVGKRLRGVGPAAVTSIAESMKRLGQLQPISVYAPERSNLKAQRRFIRWLDGGADAAQ
jgi:hypothetical protein